MKWKRMDQNKHKRSRPFQQRNHLFFRSVPLHLFIIIFLPKLPLCFSHHALINIILMIFLWVQTSIEMYFMRGARGHPSLNIYRALKFMLKFVKSRQMASQSNKPKEIILCSLSPKLLFTFLIAFYISSHKIYKNSACNESIVKQQIIQFLH